MPLDPIPGRCAMPWPVFAGLAKVQAMAATPEALADLKDHLSRSGLIAGAAVDVERAGAAVMRWDRQRRADAIPPRLLPATKPRRSRRSRSAGPLRMWDPFAQRTWTWPPGEWQ